MPTPFLFGKMPAHGDFVSRGLGMDQRTAWDTWCSCGLARARDVLGDAFAEKHMMAQGCCFSFGPGEFGSGWRMGAMAPALDRVGRPFMLILGVESEDRFCAHVAQSYPVTLGSLIQYAVVEGWNADEIISRIPAVPNDRATSVIPTPVLDGRFWTDRGGATALSISSCAPPDFLIPILLNPKEEIIESSHAI